jgi:hypothetical protein
MHNLPGNYGNPKDEGNEFIDRSKSGILFVN